MHRGWALCLSLCCYLRLLSAEVSGRGTVSEWLDPARTPLRLPAGNFVPQTRRVTSQGWGMRSGGCQPLGRPPPR